LKKEIAELAAAGILCRGRLFISNRAHVILDFHRLAEKGDEESREKTASALQTAE